MKNNIYKFYPDIKEKIDHIKWYKLRRVMSFAVDFMYLIGGRRYGKTYSIKSFFIEDFVKNGNRFAWFRTTEKALDKIRNEQQFFGRLENLEQLKVKDVKISGDIIYINKQEAGYLFPISTFYNIKGADYNVVNGCWDEFMRAKGERPLAGKREKFNDICESVFRYGRKRIFAISNSTNKYDDVLAPFNLELNNFGVYLFREKNSLVHYIQSSKRHIEDMENSILGQSMTESEKQFAFENKFTDFGRYGNIAKGKYLFTLQVDDDKFISFYLDKNDCYVKATLPVKSIIKATNPIYVNNRVTKLSQASLKILRQMFDNGNVIFNDGYCRSMFIDNVLPK